MTAKDRSIVDLLTARRLQENAWVMVDHWDADRHAIGIARGDELRRLVYVSTFKMAARRYDFECEAPTGAAIDDCGTTDAGADVDLAVLMAVLRRRLSRGA